MRSLIAKRIPRSDKWVLIDGNVECPSLTHTLEKYFELKNYRGEFIISPKESSLYTLNEDVKVEAKYNIYGDED